MVSPPNTPPTSLLSVSSEETCIDTASDNETLGDSTSSLPIAGSVDGLVQHLVDGTKRLADVDELLEAALKSFGMIAKWYAETPLPGNREFVSIADGARAAGKDYVESVRESVKVAGHGVAFAADIINLCDCCSNGIDIDVSSYVDDMRKIVQQALDEATTTNQKFRDIRKRLLQLIREIPVQQRRIEERQNNHQHKLNGQDHIGALELLEKAFNDMSQLVEAVAKFADWWCQAKIMVSALEIQMFIGYPRTNLDRLQMAREGWKSVRERYEVYKRTMDALDDIFPVDNTPTFGSILGKIMAWLTGA